jgi:hypothetical protein
MGKPETWNLKLETNLPALGVLGFSGFPFHLSKKETL